MLITTQNTFLQKSDFSIKSQRKTQPVIQLAPTPALPRPVKSDLESVKKYTGKGQYFFGEFHRPLKWKAVILLIILHIVGLYGLLTFEYIQKFPLFCFLLMTGIFGGLGITAGAHRLFSHRSYKARTPLKILLLIMYSAAGQNTLPSWVRDHRIHHLYSDTDKDPHNSERGFFFSHVGWLMMKRRPEVVKELKRIDVTDVTEDPLVKFHTKYFAIFVILFTFVIPIYLTKSMSTLSWTNATIFNISRYILLLNFVWSVNSFAHIYGHKPIDKKIKPSENVWVSFVALGEGWHNYHHIFPWDYRTSEVGARFNLTRYMLDFFGKIGWAYDFKFPSEKLVDQISANHGDGTRMSPMVEMPKT